MPIEEVDEAIARVFRELDWKDAREDLIRLGENSAEYLRAHIELDHTIPSPSKALDCRRQMWYKAHGTESDRGLPESWILAAMSGVVTEPIWHTVLAHADPRLEPSPVSTLDLGYGVGTCDGELRNLPGKPLIELKRRTGWAFEFSRERGFQEEEENGVAQAQDYMKAAGRKWTLMLMSVADHCVTLETPVLKADLNWVPASALRVGDKVLSFDETGSAGVQPKWRMGTVRRVGRKILPAQAISLSDGRELACTPDHRWRIPRATHHTGWIETDRMNSVGPHTRLARYLYPWEQDTSYGAAYLAGLYDGEGSVTPDGVITFSQKEGPVLDRAAKLLTKLGFDYHISPTHGNIKQICLRGGTAAQLRFLGVVRPLRLIPQYLSKIVNRKRLQCIDKPQVVAIENLAPQEMVTLAIDPPTYFAQGFGSHNSFYQNIMRKFKRQPNKRFPFYLVEWIEFDPDYSKRITERQYGTVELLTNDEPPAREQGIDNKLLDPDNGNWPCHTPDRVGGCPFWKKCTERGP